MSDTPVTASGKFEIFKDKNKKHRFRFVHDNGKTMFQSSEGYTRKIDMMACIEAAQMSSLAPVVEGPSKSKRINKARKAKSKKTG